MENKSLENDTISEFFKNNGEVTKTLHAGIRLALLKHKQAGNSVCTWREGKVVWVESDNIPFEKEKT